MNDRINAWTILFCSYFLNAGVWLSNFSMWLKIALAVIAGATTIMAFFNQYKTFQKNYKAFWVVITINHVFTFLTPKKSRHRGINISRKKKTIDNEPS